MIEHAFALLTDILLPGFLASLVLGWVALRFRFAGLAFLAGLAVANGWSKVITWWDTDAGWGVLYPLLLLSLITLFLDPRRRVLLIVGTMLLAGLSVLLYRVETQNVVHQSAGIAATVVCYLVLCYAEVKLPRWWYFGLLAATGMAGSVVMLHAHSARLGDVGFLWLSACGGLLVASLLRRRDTQQEVRGVAGLGALWLPFLAYLGEESTFSLVPIWSFVLLAVAPAGVLVLELLPAKNRFRYTIASCTWLLLLALALGLAMMYESVAMPE